MEVEYDPRHDIMNREFISDVEIDESVELDGIIIDYTREKKIVSMEILDLKKRTKTDPFETINFVLMKGKVKI
jgi:uncharacterized protein YuzE